MPKPTLTPQVPVVEAAQAQWYELSSGERAQLAVPDLYSILAQVGIVPDQLTAAVLKLLKSEGSYTPENDGRYYQILAAEERGRYALYSLCRRDKYLDLNRVNGDGDGILGRCDVPYNDLLYVENRFFRSRSAIPLSGNPAPADTSGIEGAAPSGGDVPSTTE